MLKTLAVTNYRSLLHLVIPLSQLNVVAGANGTGKSSLYRSLRLLSEVATGKLVSSIANEGGLQSCLWAGPQAESENSSIPLEQPSMRTRPVRLQLGFASDECSYSVDLGLAPPNRSAFSFDPIIKRECVWLSDQPSNKSLCADRHGGVAKCRGSDGAWVQLTDNLATFESLLTQCADPIGAPDLIVVREMMRSWRFYDHLRTDRDAPARQLHVGTYTPILSNDGSDLAAALQTIREIGNEPLMNQSISDAFPDSTLEIRPIGSRLELNLDQPGLSRALTSSELSEGTLRYLMLVAALLSPRPPELIVLNEPEMSLHPELLPALARLIAASSEKTQVIVVTHSHKLNDELMKCADCNPIMLEKFRGATQVVGSTYLDRPLWKWPNR